MRKILAIVLIFVSFQAKATNYYFSTVSGNDISGNGSISLPFKTLSKLSSFWLTTTPQPGDSFLLKRGETFYGSIVIGKSGTAARNFIVAGYGAGSDPIITGMTAITSWTNLGSNIYESNAITGGLPTCEIVTINGIKVEKGRFPNSSTANGGYNTIDSHNGTISITDAALPTSPNWTNAELVLRVRRYVISRNLITNHAGTVLTYTSSTNTAPLDAFGYFIQNSVLTLDRQNEWYYNPSTRKLRMYSTTSPVNVAVSTINNLVVSNSKSYVKFTGMTFNGSNDNTIHLTGGIGNSVINCTLNNAGAIGIWTDSRFTLIQNCTITNSNDNFIQAGYSGDNMTVKNCTMDSTGVIKGAGGSGFGAYCGVVIRPRLCTVENNSITHTGYTGVLFYPADSVYIHNNKIDYVCFNEDDGGGIYTVNNTTPANTYRRIVGNVISNGIGAGEGTDSPPRETIGLYFDVRSAGIIADSNSVSNFQYGAFIHFSNRITLRYNTTYNCDFQVGQAKRAGDLSTGIAINDNIFFSRTATQRPFNFSSDADNINLIGAINVNHFANFSTQTTPFRLSVPATTVYSLAGWRTKTGFDLTSTQKPYLASDTIRYVSNATNSPLAVDLTSQGQAYSWSDIFSTNYTSLVLSPYTSKVLFRGAVVSGSTPPVASISNTPILCNGGTSIVTVSATSGTAPYTGTGTFTVTAGSYTYMVSDANNLKDTVSVTISQPTLETLSESHTAILVNGGTSTVTFTSTGGTGVKTYKIGAGSYQSSNIFAGVIAGNYTGYVKDANNCITTLNFSITQPSVLNGTATAGTILCSGGTTTVTVSASGGTSPYSGTGTFTRAAGSWQFIIIDNVGARDTVYITVTQPIALTLSETHTTISIFGNSSTVTLTASGGTGSKAYKINTGSYQSSNTFTLLAGSYTASVKDINGCVTTLNFVITEPTEFIGAISVIDSILCNGGSTSVTVAASGGIAPYTGLGTFTVSAGLHTYPLSDAAGAKDTVSILVTQPTVLTLSEGHTAILSYGGTSTVTLTAGGGTGIDSFKLGTGSYQLSNVFAGVFGGPNTATVKDANGCTTTINFTITQPAPSNPPIGSESHGSILCFGGTASVTISATGGTTPYVGTGVFTQSVGTTSYIITGNNGEKDTVDVTLTEPSLLTLTQSYPAISSFGGSTTLTLTAGGGTGSKTYSIGGAYQSSNVFSGVTAGTYTASVKDANNCITSNSIVIVEPSATPPQAAAQYDSILCYGGSTIVNITGTNGLSPYSGVGAFTRAAGAWSFTITDSAGLSSSVSVNITQPAPLTLSVTSASNYITLIPRGGTGIDSFALDNGSYQLSPTFSSLSAGSYTASVKDASGCTASVSFTIGNVNSATRIKSSYKLRVTP